MLKDYYKYPSTQDRLQAIQEDDDLHGDDNFAGWFIGCLFVIAVVLGLLIYVALRWFA